MTEEEPENPFTETIARIESNRTADGALGLSRNTRLDRSKEKLSTPIDVLEHLVADELISDISAKRHGEKLSIAQRLKDFLQNNPSEVDFILRALIRQGKIGNVVAIKELLDRVDGKVAERHKIEGELPVKIIFVPASEVPETAPDSPSDPKGE